jgi:nitroreductase
MNEVLNCLETRRSVRKYLPKQITDAELDAVLRAGTYAPTAMGRQSPKIVVLQKPEDIARLERMNAAVLQSPDAKPFYGAPTVCLVLADAAIPTAVEDGSLVMGNLMNAAHALGLGSCWINRAREEFASEEGKALLRQWGIEGEWIGVGHCILGYPDGAPAPARPRKADYIVKV